MNFIDLFKNHLEQKHSAINFKNIFKIVEKNNIDKIKEYVQNGEQIADLKNEFGYTVLMESILLDRQEISKILIKNSKNINYCDNNGYSALFFAIDSGKTDTVKLLLNNGANTNQQTKKGRTPLMCAVKNSNQKIVNMLANRCDKKITDIYGLTVSDYAKLNHVILNIDDSKTL